MKSINLSFRFITAAVFILLIAPVLFQDGMFMDGIQYACVSKNLATGEGSFWFPYLSATWNKSGQTAFLEHPPLVYSIQSLFFEILGNSRFTERIYSFTTAILSAWIISLLWRLLFADSKFKKLDWLPILFWIITPICFWSYQNNMQENTLGVFTLAAVYFSLKALLNPKNSYQNIIISGLFIFLASLCKGIPGLFPLTVPFIFWLVSKKTGFRGMVFQTITLLLIPISIYTVVLQNPSAYYSLKFWLIHRVMARMLEEPTTAYRFDAIWRVFTELIPAIVLTGSLYQYHFRKGLKRGTDEARFIWIFTLIGLAGSIPLIISLVQKGFYLVPAFPFFSIALAVIAAPAANQIITRLQLLKALPSLLRIASIGMLGASIAISVIVAQKPGRDKGTLSDIKRLSSILPPNSTIGAGSDVFDDWQLQFYLLRYYNISIDPSDNSSKYILTSKERPLENTGHYTKSTIDMEKYILFIRRGEFPAVQHK